MHTEVDKLYRKLPQLGELLHTREIRELVELYSRELVVDAARESLSRIRQEIRMGQHTEASLNGSVAQLAENIREELAQRVRPSLRRVINATGVILQTNLGRAPLSEDAIRQIGDVARGFCNLEMDLDTGERGFRDRHADSLILDVLALRSGVAVGSLHERRAAAVVNNCAAATFLALNTLAEGGEVIVSRGELVEIGGGFRIPEILRKSGAILREVGTTNRTRIEDYAAALTPDTRLILRVHRSNFRIEGFTQRPTLQELIQFGQSASVPVFEDQGTGCVVALDECGIAGESTWITSAISDAALISASGDKLLGGPQCGILTGDRAFVERIRKNPLFRALRVDKLTYAALQATLLAYLTGRDESIPAIAMLLISADRVRQRCEAYVEALKSSTLRAEIIATSSLVGGGTTPGATLPSFGVRLRHEEISEGTLAARLRQLDLPIIARTSEGGVVLDLRTVAETDDQLVVASLQSAFAPGRALEPAQGNRVAR